MEGVFKLKVVTNIVNQAALHFKMNNPTPSVNWLDTAKRIGYFPKLSKYLRELEEKEILNKVNPPLEGNFEKMMKEAEEEARKETGVLRGKVTTPFIGESASLPLSKKKSPIQKTTKPKRTKE